MAPPAITAEQSSLILTRLRDQAGIAEARFFPWFTPVDQRNVASGAGMPARLPMNIAA
jgi:hypothetical protein